MRLVKLPGAKVWINPKYVTSVRPSIHGTIVEYEGNAGYRTRTETIPAPTEEVVALLEGVCDENK